jgi:uncharacterized protein (TIGR02145 family)
MFGDFLSFLKLRLMDSRFLYLLLCGWLLFTVKGTTTAQSIPKLPVKQQPVPKPVPAPKPKPKAVKNIDRDGDGLTNDVDRCPDEKGTIENHGCPDDYDLRGAVDIGITEVVYESVTIGTQKWMKVNLDVDAFRNSDPIPEAKTKEEWVKAEKEKKPAWCYYNNDPAYGEVYGKIYNWWAVNDSRGLAPEGWRIPLPSEWNRMSEAAGGKNAAPSLKSTKFWNAEHVGGVTNSSRFSGLPGGYRDTDGSFKEIGSRSLWWTRHSYPHSSAPQYLYVVFRALDVKYEYVQECYHFSGNGAYVRCIKE